MCARKWSGVCNVSQLCSLDNDQQALSPQAAMKKKKKKACFPAESFSLSPLFLHHPQSAES